ITDIALSVDDRDLYVSCWGTGELKRYDVSDSHRPRETGSVRLGGIVGQAPHPAAGALQGGPQMVEVSRDGRRGYLTNSLYAAMGWLFAVSQGLQQGDRRAVVRSFAPIAIGHEAAVVVVAAFVLGLGVIADPGALHVGAAAVLVAFGLWRFVRPHAHPRWTTMR